MSYYSRKRRVYLKPAEREALKKVLYERFLEGTIQRDLAEEFYLSKGLVQRLIKEASGNVPRGELERRRLIRKRVRWLEERLDEDEDESLMSETQRYHATIALQHLRDGLSFREIEKQSNYPRRSIRIVIERFLKSGELL